MDELSQRRLEPGYWDDPNAAREVEKEIAAEKEWIDAWEGLKRLAEDVETLMELADLIVCTGSQDNVRRAYSSGTPAIGVGKGISLQ